VHSTAVVLLAGGYARRFPGKLEHPIDGRPLLAHVYARVRATGWPIFIAGKASFSRALDAPLDAPLLLDRRPASGPLRAFADACGVIAADRIFAVAADQPRIEAELLKHLAAMWQPGDEAVVPEHDGRIEPLAAIYDRRAVLREHAALRRSGKSAMRDLIAYLTTRFVPCDATHFVNLNRPEDAPLRERAAP
jgi:molybdopterin-guanine dinucleotide biosynthesis protein A